MRSPENQPINRVYENVLRFMRMGPEMGVNSFRLKGEDVPTTFHTMVSIFPAPHKNYTEEFHVIGTRSGEADTNPIKLYDRILDLAVPGRIKGLD